MRSETKRIPLSVEDTLPPEASSSTLHAIKTRHAPPTRSQDRRQSRSAYSKVNSPLDGERN